MKKTIQTYKDLLVWQKSMDFVIATYALTEEFPKNELYGLVSQMRRAAVSIPSNLAEGYRRSGRKEYRHFVLISYGSGAELETQLEIVRRLGYVEDKYIAAVESSLTEIMKMLNKLSSALFVSSTPHSPPPTP